MKEQLEAIRAAAKQALSDCADSKLLETLRVQYLGKKGELTGILKQMGKLSAEEPHLRSFLSLHTQSRAVFCTLSGSH